MSMAFAPAAEESQAGQAAFPAGRRRKLLKLLVMWGGGGGGGNPFLQRPFWGVFSSFVRGGGGGEKLAFLRKRRGAFERPQRKAAGAA